MGISCLNVTESGASAMGTPRTHLSTSGRYHSVGALSIQREFSLCGPSEVPRSRPDSGIFSAGIGGRRAANVFVTGVEQIELMFL